MHLLSIVEVFVVLSLSNGIIIKREAPLPSLSSPPFSFGSFHEGLDLPNYYDNVKNKHLSIPSSTYGTPNRPSFEYGVPHKPSFQYGPPKPSVHHTGSMNSYLPPRKPSIHYGIPPKPSQIYSTSSSSSSYSSTVQAKPITSYGPPPSGHFGISSSSHQYIPPATHTSPPISPSYGIPSFLSSSYGAPSQHHEVSSFGSESFHNSAASSHNVGGTLGQKYDANGGYVY